MGVLVSPNGQGNQIMARTIYPDRQSFPDSGSDPYMALTVHPYDPWDFCGQTGSNAFFGGVRSMQNKIRGQFQDLFNYVSATNIPTYLGEYGVGRLPEREWERNTELVREYYTLVTNLFIDRGVPTAVWDDQGWFSIMKGTNQFVYGLSDSILSGPPPSTSSPTPSSGGGCCRNYQGVCGCGVDGTGWCNDNASNCGVCMGSWDPAGATPTCR